MKRRRRTTSSWSIGRRPRSCTGSESRRSVSGQRDGRRTHLCGYQTACPGFSSDQCCRTRGYDHFACPKGAGFRADTGSRHRRPFKLHTAAFPGESIARRFSKRGDRHGNRAPSAEHGSAAQHGEGFGHSRGEAADRGTVRCDHRRSAQGR